jgi:hypothetical protein
MNWTSILLLAISVLPSCQTSPSAKALNRSALYDPPMISLQRGITYRFVEGDLVGRGQFFHSDYAFQNAFLLGLKPPTK